MKIAVLNINMTAVKRVSSALRARMIAIMMAMRTRGICRFDFALGLSKTKRPLNSGLFIYFIFVYGESYIDCRTLHPI
jgi:hypothetical protein